MASDAPVNLAFKQFNPVPEGGPVLPPILFLHAVTSSRENWGTIPQTIANATNRKAFALDIRSHGDTEWRDRLDFECMVDDLLHFMDTKKFAKAIIVGHSLGGIICIKTALRKPERVEKLIVEDMYTKKIPQTRSDTILEYLRLVTTALEKAPDGIDKDATQKFVVEYVYEKLVPQYVLPKVTRRTWREIEVRPIENGRFALKFNVDAVVNMLKNIDETLKENEGLHEGPTAFVYGAMSPYKVAEEKEHIQKLFPNVEFFEIPDAAHRVHSDSGPAFTDAVIKFILKE